MRFERYIDLAAASRALQRNGGPLAKLPKVIDQYRAAVKSLIDLRRADLALQNLLAMNIYAPEAGVRHQDADAVLTAAWFSQAVVSYGRAAIAGPKTKNSTPIFKGLPEECRLIHNRIKRVRNKCIAHTEADDDDWSKVTAVLGVGVGGWAVTYTYSDTNFRSLNALEFKHLCKVAIEITESQIEKARAHITSMIMEHVDPKALAVLEGFKFDPVDFFGNHEDAERFYQSMETGKPHMGHWLKPPK